MKLALGFLARTASRTPLRRGALTIAGQGALQLRSLNNLFNWAFRDGPPSTTFSSQPSRFNWTFMLSTWGCLPRSG
jgi:hypothetical protein